MYAAVAIHPNNTVDAVASALTADKVLAEIEALAGTAAGGRGRRDGPGYYRDHAAPDVQRWWFREHIEIAKRTGKALMIHDREAHADVLRILAEEEPPGPGCVPLLLRRRADGQAVRRGGLRDVVRGQRDVRQRAAARPPPRPPRPISSWPRPMRRSSPRCRTGVSLTQPALVADTLRCLAEVKGMDVADLCNTVTATAQRTLRPLVAACPAPSTRMADQEPAVRVLGPADPNAGRSPRCPAVQAAGPELRRRARDRSEDRLRWPPWSRKTWCSRWVRGSVRSRSPCWKPVPGRLVAIEIEPGAGR